jgi:hypothetical protein
MSRVEPLDPDWESYPETVLHFTASIQFALDLRKKVNAEDRKHLRAAGLPDAFAVITASDPLGEDLAPGINADRQRELEANLSSRGVQFVVVNACSPDATHCERSVAAAIAKGDALELARQYEQIAIFWFDGAAFWIVPVLARSKPLRLPRQF